MNNSRRHFLRQSAAAALVWATTGRFARASPLRGGTDIPWYQRITRWGQVNITEKDPAQYDVGWWRSYWRRTETQGVIINAGGIVAYYPTKIPYHRKAEYLQGADLFGDLCRAAHEDGLAVFARMDSNRAHEEFYQAHPDWFAVDAAGKPYKAADLYLSCINSPYYSEHIPAILKEIAIGYHPEGFTDNSWSGLGRESICYCGYCQKSFRGQTGYDLPRIKDWHDKVYKEWIVWSYQRRLELWDLNNRVTKAAGGPHCTWSGMNSGSISAQSRSFRDFAQIARRADIIMLDDQARTDTGGFQHNGEAGKLIHGLLGWDKLIPESMAMYQAHKPWFRVASKPEPEARMWMIEGIAGGIQPWWHMVSAYHEDRRMYHNPEAIFRWHKANEEFLIHRRPVATIGVVWSQRNMDFYGRDAAEELVELPWRGMTGALIRARLPYLPVHADHIDRDADGLSLLILPNLAVMNNEQVAAVKRFVARGGSLFATGDSSLFDEWGESRSDFALADLFGAHLTIPRHPYVKPALEKMAGEAYHTYFRLTPEWRGRTEGPHNSSEPPATGNRHAILQGFEETDILPFGGLLDPLRLDAGAEVLLTFIPQFPVYPPEKAWMRTPRTDIPGLILREGAAGGSPAGAGQQGAAGGDKRGITGGSGPGRVVFLPADVDRQYGRSNLPDHGNLLKNIIRWALREEPPVVVEGAGLVDCHFYRQDNRAVLHLVNLSNENTWRQSLDELITIGPLTVKVKLPAGVNGSRLRLLVSGEQAVATTAGGWCHFSIQSILDHEVVVIE
ncbi:MAG TPA: hypothetical protein VL832_04190 [Puia sp.]|nr:hypothetical protein [Puia sp.]